MVIINGGRLTLVIYPTAGTAGTTTRVRVSNMVSSTFPTDDCSCYNPWAIYTDCTEPLNELAMGPQLCGPMTPSPQIMISNGTGATTASALYCKIWNENSVLANEWYRIENAEEAFNNTCQTAVSEWAWADDNSTHACTTAYKYAFIRNGYIYQKPMSPEDKKLHDEKMLKQRFQQIIRKRCAPNIIVKNSKRQPLPMPADIREQRARDTLRRVIGDNKFGNFRKHGFISIKARSGLVYQIFPGHGFTNVYNQGQMVECLCVVLRGDFPPTDSLIMRYLLILNNEQQFRSYANKQLVDQSIRSRLHGEVDTKSLTEIFRDLKKKIA